jgi:hypothetical protein
VGVGVDPLVRLRDAHAVEQVDRVLAGDLLGDAVVDPVRLDDLVADRVVRMHRRQRILEDHRHLLAAQLPHVFGRGADQFLAVQPDLTRDLGRTTLVQPQDAEAGHALAGPGLPDDPERLAALQVERQPVDGLDQAVVGREVDP